MPIILRLFDPSDRRRPRSRPLDETFRALGTCPNALSAPPPPQRVWDLCKPDSLYKKLRF